MDETDLPDLIVKQLYLGNELNSMSREQLAELNITHICNVGWPNTLQHFKDIDYKSIQIDENSPDVLNDIDECFRFIDSARKAGKSVLLHCKSGNTKSGLKF